MKLSSAQQFLRAFHDHNPGATTLALSAAADASGRSSYERLARLEAVVPRGGRVLDLACGDGYLLQEISARRGGSLSLVGVDMSEAELRAAKARGVSGASFIQGDVEALELDEGSFDLVLCHMAFMLFDDPDAVARVISRVLKPQGRCAVVLGDGSSPAGARRIFVELVKEAITRYGGTCPQLGSREVRSIAGLKAVMARAGLEPLSTDNFYVEIGGDHEEILNNLKLMYNFEPLSQAGKLFVEERFLERMRAENDAPYRLSLVEGVFCKPSHVPGGEQAR